MDEVLPYLILAGGALLVVALGVSPLLRGWPERVRWTVVSQTLANMNLPFSPPVDFREVVVLFVHATERFLEVRVLEVGPIAAHALVLESPRPSSELVAMLSEWSLLRTPMLLYLDPTGKAMLTGPVASVALQWRQADEGATSRPEETGLARGEG
jgi:hypothetical protein